jgi:hypothetical protein
MVTICNLFLEWSQYIKKTFDIFEWILIIWTCTTGPFTPPPPSMYIYCVYLSTYRICIYVKKYTVCCMNIPAEVTYSYLNSALKDYIHIYIYILKYVVVASSTSLPPPALTPHILEDSWGRGWQERARQIDLCINHLGRIRAVWPQSAEEVSKHWWKLLPKHTRAALLNMLWICTRNRYAMMPRYQVEKNARRACLDCWLCLICSSIYTEKGITTWRWIGAVFESATF